MKNLPKDTCTGCMLCAAVCPQHCITEEKDNEGFWFPKIDLQKCIQCGKCERICPVNNMLDKNVSMKSFSAYASDDSIRLSSSSGGVFYCFAETILENNGIVCAAAFDDDYMSVKHVCVTKRDELEILKGSKYVQSDISNVFIIIEKYLNKNRRVLFVGTPCEVAAVKKYFFRNTDLLTTIDIICHGVPSELVWSKYLESVHKGRTISSISMRDKKYGWKNFAMKVSYKNHPQYIKSLAFDLYLRGFLENLYLRKSCYDCHFKSIDRIGDVTIGDYWGKELNEHKGISLIGINTHKGANLFESTKIRLIYEECDWEKAIAKNIAATQSAKRNLNRSVFFDELENCDSFTKSVNKCLSKRSIKDNLYYYYQLSRKKRGEK